MQLARLSNLKHFLWLTILPLVGCTSHEHFNRPYSDQSGAKVVPSWCHNRVGPEELLLFFLGETKVEVTLLSDKESQTLLVHTSSKKSHSVISDQFSILQDGNEAKILEVKESDSSYFHSVVPDSFYFSDISIKASGDYKEVFTLQGLEIVINGVAYPIENITFKKDEDVFLNPWNC
ncbi:MULTISPECIES: hypothetical protein [Marinomonas]|uniref:Uncharacterized protein n=1 Tax=Marinomonas polaris DSM 16579 TaxID=1122206 RepID=A0A1M4Y7R0_9GAMM|nr:MULTISPECIES: hypothetical protein [Marinomonas]SHF01646.1 hypothetical protein SAMN02745753_01146 [Marinomonas polaris DSM 16579]|tara:strand:+ start:8955 stop:9485 length:531 start_codon:yes stop_codon:yes gene_type:complete